MTGRVFEVTRVRNVGFRLWTGGPEGRKPLRLFGSSQEANEEAERRHDEELSCHQPGVMIGKADVPLPVLKLWEASNDGTS